MNTVPVNMMAICWLVETRWAGLLKSPMFEIEIIHLNDGAQKKTLEKYIKHQIDREV